MVAQQSAGLARLVGHPMIAASAARLLRTSQVRLYTSTLLAKPPNLHGDQGKVGWHADLAYMRNCSAERMVTAWVSLHDCPVEMGPITMAAGSNRWPNVGPVKELRYKRTFRSGEVERLLAEIADLGHHLDHQPVVVKRGQVSFHDHRIFHGSDVNRTDDLRVSLIIELQPRDNHYVPREGDDIGPVYVHQNDRRCARLDGDRPDYSDPVICPILWDDGTGRSPGPRSRR
jgi:ectoine hydroxylase-related dioxygenase (phytanoyl-CoA dioxygenase family)